MNIYSKTGSEEFNKFLDKNLHALGKEIEQAMGDSFLAIILAGGYGRGDGACVLIDGKESPYNDFDLFVVVSKRMVIPKKVLDITKKYEKSLGIDVDIGKPLTLDIIKNLPHQLMWQDLLESHKVIVGNPNILNKNAPSYLSEKLPQIEALRLLLNRGSGLLQAISHSYESSQDKNHNFCDKDFIRRNKEKCTLALGDSLLIIEGLYEPPLEHRTKTLKEHSKNIPISQRDRIISLHTQAAQFKTRPDSLKQEQPDLAELKEVASLWVDVMLYCEKKRTGKEWQKVTNYAKDHFIREPEQHTPKNLLRNLGKNLKDKKLSFLYPRERLYGQLALLLENPEPEKDSWRKEADSFLRTWLVCN